MVSQYNVQCLDGHVFTPSEGSELENDCRRHEEKGFLDALVVDASECPKCQQKRARSDAILERVAADEAYLFDAKHPNAVERYLRGDTLD